MASLTCGWMHRLIGFNHKYLPPPLTFLSSAALSRETEGGRHVQRQASKGVHLTALFADEGIHTSTPNHTAVNQCGGLSVERFKVNKHHSSLAETAGGYVHLGCAPAALVADYFVSKVVCCYTQMAEVIYLSSSSD